MSTRVSTKPVPIRTYAADLERARGEAVTATPTTVETKPPAKEVKKPAPTIPDKVKAPTQQPIPKKLPTPPPIPKVEEAPKKTRVPSEPLEKVSAPHPKPLPHQTTHTNQSAPNKIPAFHELQKQTNKAISDSKTSKKTSVQKPKKKKASLLSSLINSIKKLFKRSQKKSTSVYSVPDAQTRKGIIQKATSKSGTTFTADSESLKERIRRRKAEEKQAAEQDTYWSPNTNTGYALLETAENDVSISKPEPIQNVAIEHKKHTTAKPNRPTPAPTAEPETEPVIQEPVAYTTAVPEIEPEVIQPQEVSEVSAPQPTDLPSQPLTKRRLEKHTTIFQQDTNTLTLQVMGGLVAVFALVVSGVLVFQSITAETTPETTPMVAQAMISNATLQLITVTSENANDLPDLITLTAESAPVGVVEFLITGPDGVEVSPSYLFSLLSFDTLPILRQSITTAHFVNVNNSQPALLFTFTNKEAVQGSLLEWESTMASDMTEIYSLPNTNGRFVDQQVNGIDTRILAEDGSTILMYSFINEQTVLISPSRATFTHIADLYRN